ncbi:MAG: hypothetical protein ABSG76_21085 [Xanthobacteraceae bacterium]|jgi:hypothetical protein
MRKLVLALGLLVAGCAMALGQVMRMPINADDARRGLAPKVFPAGDQTAVISGDSFKDGLHVVRLELPANQQIPAHNHSTSEYVTALCFAWCGQAAPSRNDRGAAVTASTIRPAVAPRRHSRR